MPMFSNMSKLSIHKAALANKLPLLIKVFFIHINSC